MGAWTPAERTITASPESTMARSSLSTSRTPAVYILLGTSTNSAGNFWRKPSAPSMRLRRIQSTALTTWTPQWSKNEGVERVGIAWPDCLSDPVFHFCLQVLLQCLSHPRTQKAGQDVGHARRHWVLRKMQTTLMPSENALPSTLTTLL